MPDSTATNAASYTTSWDIIRSTAHVSRSIKDFAAASGDYAVCTFHSTSSAKEALVLLTEFVDDEGSGNSWWKGGELGIGHTGRDGIGSAPSDRPGSGVPDSREADDSMEPVAVSSLARCAHETLEEIERNWRSTIGTLRDR